MAATTITTAQLRDAANFLRGNAAEYVVIHRVDAIAVANVDLSAPGATVGGTSMSAGMRFLATEQTAGSENGVYLWSGAASAATRATDFDTAEQWRIGTRFFCQGGDLVGQTWFLISLTSNPPIVGTDTCSFVVVDMGFALGNLHREVPPNETPDDVEDTFTFPPVSSDVSYLLITKNGVVQADTDYSLSGTDVVFAAPPATGDKIRAWFFDPNS